MSYFIAPISMGVGDLIVSLPVVQALIDSGQDTYLVSRHKSQYDLASRISGLSGVVAEDQFDRDSLNSADVYVNMREHPLQKNFWWGSPSCDLAYPGYKINDLLKIISGDFDIKADFEKLRPLHFEPVKEVESTIVFIPGAGSEYKSWPKNNWLSLASLFKQNGIQVYVVGEPEVSVAVRELLPHLHWLPSPKLSDALDIISSAQGVIAVDTGLMHLAVHQGIPTIALYRSHPIYERNYPHCFTLSARPCDARCIDESLQYTHNSIVNLDDFVYQSWQCQADDEQSCMNSISCNSVMAIINNGKELFLRRSGTLS